jgi:hypothetical protein
MAVFLVLLRGVSRVALISHFQLYTPQGAIVLNRLM